MQIPRKVEIAVATVLTLAAAFSASRYEYDRLIAADEDVKQARAATVVAIDAAIAASKTADSLAAQAQAALRAEHAAKARADSLAHVAARFQGALAAVAQTAPDTCRPVVLAADSALAAKDAQIADLHVALDSADAANARLVAAHTTSRAALLPLTESSAALVSATKKAEHRSKLSAIFAAITPHPGIGVAAGLTPVGQPQLVVGLTFGWHL